MAHPDPRTWPLVTGGSVLAGCVGSPHGDKQGCMATHSLSSAPQPGPVSWWHLEQCTWGLHSPLDCIFPRQSMWGHASAPAMSWLHGRTQTAFAPPDSLRAGCFTLCSCPGFPAFEFALPQKHPIINKPPGVLLCTASCPVPVSFSTCTYSHRSRDHMPGWHYQQDKVCHPWGSPQPGCTCTGVGDRLGHPTASPAHPAFFPQSVAPISQV